MRWSRQFVDLHANVYQQLFRLINAKLLKIKMIMNFYFNEYSQEKWKLSSCGRMLNLFSQLNL